MSSDVGAPTCDPDPAEAAILSHKRTRDPSSKLHREVAAVQRLVKPRQFSKSRARILRCIHCAKWYRRIGDADVHGVHSRLGANGPENRGGDPPGNGCSEVVACNADQAAKLFQSCPHAIDSAKRPELP